MNNMNNFNSSTPDALSSSKAILGSGNDLGMHRRDGDKELEDSKYLQRNSITIQGPSNTLSNRSQWRSDTKNNNNTKCDHITNLNCTGCTVLHILDELLSKEKKKEEENEKKKEEKNKGKKEEKNKRKKGGKKGKKKEKKGKRGSKFVEIHGHGSKDIFMSTPGSVNKLDEHSGASPQLHKTSNISKCVLEDQSQKNNSSLFRSISDISKQGRQESLGQDSTEKRHVPFPTRSEWNNKSKERELEIRELCGNDPLDLPGQVGAQCSDQNMHNRCANETKEATLFESPNLPDYICEHLDKNNRFGFHQITNRDSLDFVDAEYIEYLNEKFGITGIQPVFVDHSGYVIWILDKDGNMYEWDEMQQNLQYMGKDLINGLTNNFIYPENICEVMEGTGERIPVMEFERQMEEKAERMWNNRQIIIMKKKY